MLYGNTGLHATVDKFSIYEKKTSHCEHYKGQI